MHRIVLKLFSLVPSDYTEMYTILKHDIQHKILELSKHTHTIYSRALEHTATTYQSVLVGIRIFASPQQACNH